MRVRWMAGFSKILMRFAIRFSIRRHIFPDAWGYCMFHHGYVTAHQMKMKRCLQKNCNALIKQPSSTYWQNLERQKQQKLLRKAEIKRQKAFAASARHTPSQPDGSHKKPNPVQKKKRYVCLDLEMCELTSKQRESVKGLKGEVIQIGAVMLDENLCCISEFSSLVKPIYGQISAEIESLTGISSESVLHADTFTTAFYKFFSWVGNDDVTTFCWSDSDYTQLWDEIFIKARNHDEYRAYLRTFVDLQAVFGKTLGAKKTISLDAALRFCHLRFKGRRHSAFADAFNTARILYKLVKNSRNGLPYDFIASYTETEMSKRYYKVTSFDKDYTSSIASFLSPDLLEKLGYSGGKNTAAAADEKTDCLPSVQRNTTNFITKHFACSRYGIKFADWLLFSVRMRFMGDVTSPAERLLQQA